MNLDDVKGDGMRNDSTTCDKDMKAGNTDNVNDESGRRFHCDSCLFDDIETKAVAFCISCIDYLCKDCVRDHKRSRLTRTHNVLEGSELPKNPDTFKMLKSMMSCPDHPEMEISFECKDHGAFICSSCLAVNHRKCDEVTEVCKTPTADTGKFELLDLLKTVRENNVSVRTAIEGNIKLLHNDKISVTMDRAKVIEKVHKHVCLLEESSMSATEEVFEEVLNALKKEENECKEIENDATKHIELLDLTMKYGNHAELNVISKLTHMRAKSLKDHNYRNGKHINVRVKFDENETITDLSTIGNTIICRGEKKKNASARNKENKSTLECSSDSLIENPVYKRDKVEKNTRNPGTKIQNKVPLMQSKVGRTRQMHDKGEGYDMSTCALSGILLLSDGQMVVSDYGNKLIKILNLDFSVNKKYLFDGSPIDMCETLSGGLAVLLEDRKVINRYNVTEGTIYQGFNTKLYPISIDGPLESYDQVVVLFSDKARYSEVKGNIEVQVRNMRDGSIIRLFTDFKSKLSLQLTLQDPRRIYKMPKSQNTFLISENSKLFCFETLKQHENTLKEKWFFKSYNYNIVDGITDIAADKDGNIYVCGKKSKNIHQISGTNFMNNRVLLSVPGTPLSVCIDDENRRIVIGCEGESSIYVTNFE